jgi:hypothetical protein
MKFESLVVQFVYGMGLGAGYFVMQLLLAKFA